MGPQGRPHRAALCNGVKVGVLAGNLRGQLALAHSNRAPTASSAVVTSEHLGRIAPPLPYPPQMPRKTCVAAGVAWAAAGLMHEVQRPWCKSTSCTRDWSGM